MPLLLQAQVSPTTPSILQHYISQNSEAVYATQQQFLANESLYSPWLKELEFRTETDEWDLERQEYSVRLNLSSRGERRVEQSIQEHLQVGYGLKEKKIAAEHLSDGYRLLGAYRYTENRLELLRNRRSLLEDRQTVHHRMLEYSSTVELDQILKGEKDLLNIEQQILLHEQQQQQLLSQLHLDSTFMAMWLTTTWISVDSMAANLLHLSEMAPQKNADQYWREYETDLAKLEMTLEERKAKRWINFVSLKQAGRERLNTGQEFSVGLALRIPTATTNRVKRNEAQLEWLDEQSKQSLLDQKVSSRLHRCQEEFEQAKTIWNLLTQQLEQQNREELLVYYQQFADVSPLSLLQIQMDDIDHQLQLIDWEEQAYQLYVRLLDYRGEFLRRPELNFVASELKVF